MTTAELITAGLSFYSNAGSTAISADIEQRKRAHFFLTKTCNRVYDSAPAWWKLGDGSVALTAGVGTMPSDFSHMGTQGQIFVLGQTYRPLSYRPPDWLKFQIQNNPQSGTPQAYSLYGRTAAGLPKILCWPSDSSTLVLAAYTKKKPELIDAPFAPYPTATATAGLPTGAYTYKLTNITATGESEGGPTSASLSVTLFKIQVSSIPLWWGTTVTSRKLYRTAAGGTQHKLVSTLNATDTTYLDNVADGALGVDVPTSASATSGMEVYPENFHDSAIYDGLCYQLARSQGDGREMMFDAKWELGVRRLWEAMRQGQGEVKAFPAFPGLPTGHPIWSRWQAPS